MMISIVVVEYWLGGDVVIYLGTSWGRPTQRKMNDRRRYEMK
jgi:hypothetical protein